MISNTSYHKKHKQYQLFVTDFHKGGAENIFYNIIIYVTLPIINLF